MRLVKKLFIKTFGCQMNVYDSARMADVLAPSGYRPVEAPEDADLVILNTCHIREKASEKVFSELGRLAALKARRRAKGRVLLLAVGGCVAQAEGAEIQRRAPAVDIVFGPQTYHRLPDLVTRAAEAAAAGRPARLGDTEFPASVKFDHLPEESEPRGPSAYLTVQEGCDKFCTFCVVPFTRGAEYSRPAAGVLAEARRLVAGGAREVTLLGQNVNAYRGAAPGTNGDWGLGRLIRELAAIEGLARLRYTTSHPRDVDDELIAAHREVDALMPYLHLPAQSGSDRILAAMNRRHTAGDYLAVIGRLRAARPDLALSSDFIVGFPGESDADFAATLRLVREVGYAQAYSFKFSARPGTRAAEMPEAVPEPVKTARLAELQALLSRQQADFNQATVGTVFDVLLDRRGRHDGQLVGRSPFMQAVHVAAEPARLGTLVPARVRAATTNSLAGDIVTGSDRPRGPTAPRERALA